MALLDMRQKSFADSSLEKHDKKTRKEHFPEEMQAVIPWKGLCDTIQPSYPKPPSASGRPIGTDRMLRVHLLQHWLNLLDPGVEEALYGSRRVRVCKGCFI